MVWGWGWEIMSASVTVGPSEKRVEHNARDGIDDGAGPRSRYYVLLFGVAATIDQRERAKTRNAAAAGRFASVSPTRVRR